MLKERTFRVVFVSSNHGAGMAAEEKADAVVRYTGKPRSVSVSLADTLTQKINHHSAGLYRVQPQN